MLEHEMNLLENRIKTDNPENIFTYANTVATIDFTKI